LIHQKYRKTAAIFLLGDVIATAAAFFAAWGLRFQVEIVPLIQEVPDFRQYLPLLPVALLVWPIVLYFHGLYQVRRARSRMDELLTVLLATVLAAILLLAFTAAYRPTLAHDSSDYLTFSRAFLALFAAVNLLLICTSRIILRSLLQRRLDRGLGLQRILVVGAGALGKEVTSKIHGHQEFGFRVVGFVDDDPGKAESAFHGVPVLGKLADVPRLLEEERIDQVLIALPLEAHRKMLRLLQQLSQECVEVRMVPDILQYAALNATVEDLDGTPIINLSQVPLEGWHSLVKRAMDVAISLAAIAVLLPFLPIIAIAIWWEDWGPLFYSQERMGLDGKPFMIWKFRSMRVNAEASTGPVWAVKDDPRRTGVGTFLRQWSIDELPQLWNVLKGDMSIVGPRPERPAFVHEFKHKIPQYMMRHRVKAGITGWAQVHGWRGNTSIKKRIQYDLYYIQNWTLMLDVKILWMTFRSGLWHNAY
jgi:Undecaprenyl-phosphate glucose phosphotransferase